MLGICLIAALLFVIVLVTVILPKRKERSIIKEINNTFGKVPSKNISLLNSELFWKSYLQTIKPEIYTDDITWNDLDMDSVIQRINSCKSAVGDAWLYNRLRMPLESTKKAIETEKIINYYESHDKELKQCLLYLSLLGRYKGDSLDTMYLHHESMTLYKRNLWRALSVLPLISIAFLFFIPNVAIWMLIISFTANIGFTLYNKSVYESGFNAVKYFSSIIVCAKNLAKVLKKTNYEMAGQLKNAALPFEKLNKSIAVLQFNDAFNEGIGIICPLSFFSIPILSYGKIVDRISKMSNEVNKLYAAIGELDLAAGILSYRKSLPFFCIPEFAETNEICFKDLYHPLISKSAVANSALFNKNVLITGSNASGKSTFIKAIAINAILAQAVNTCTSNAMLIKKSNVATSMAVADSIIDGDSYFIAEIKSIKRLLLLPQKKFSYLFVDEILRGTNTIERVAAATSVIKYLSGLNCICFAATHDIELTSLLEKECVNIHFKETVDNEGVHFDYVMQNGPATSRNAIHLLENMDFPAQIPDNAKILAKHFEKNGKWCYTK